MVQQKGGGFMRAYALSPCGHRGGPAVPAEDGGRAFDARKGARPRGY